MKYTLWPIYTHSGVYSWAYLSSLEFLSCTSADSCPPSVQLQWAWRLENEHNLLGEGVEETSEECLRKAIALGWPKPSVVYIDRYKQVHTPLPEDADVIRAGGRSALPSPK